MTEWTLFDYGVGNLHSLRKALQRGGAKAAVTDDPRTLVDADVAVLPGVGAFGHVMESLRGAEDGLRDRHAAGRPILGVCIGQQVLHEGSNESPGVPGLGILPGTAYRIRPEAGKVPHMGWNTIDAEVADGLLGPAARQHVYYVHSYALEPGVATTATTEYGDRFSAAERQGNTVAFQFHPEKSGDVGAGILKRVVTTLEAAA